MKIRDYTEQKSVAKVKRNSFKIIDEMQVVTTRTRVEIWSSDKLNAKLLAVAAVKNPKDFDYQALLNIAKHDFTSGISA